MATPNEPNWEQTEYLLQPEPPRPARAVPGRDESIRRMRRITNWSLAALLVGVGATSAALAHVVPGHASPAVSSSSTPTGAAVAGNASGHAPAVSGAVATSNPSQVVAGGGVTSPGGTPAQPGTVSPRSPWSDS